MGVVGKQVVLSRLTNGGLVVVARGLSPAIATQVATALQQGGVDAMEVTFDRSSGAEAMKLLRRHLGDSMLVGAGTVTTVEQCQCACDLGADFIVSPVFDSQVTVCALEHDRVVVPGVMTPTEAFRAWQAGADILKIFPAGVVTSRFVKDLLGPFPSLRLMVTGDVSLEDVEGYVRAGAHIIGVGGAILNKKALSAEHFDVITRQAHAFVQKLQEARSRCPAADAMTRDHNE